MSMGLPRAPRTVVTGAGSGLGRAMALRLAQRHARILVADVHEARGAETVELVKDGGGQAHFVRCDVSNPDEVERLAQQGEQLWGGTDLLINNAGVAAAGCVGQMSIEDWKWVLRVDFWGVLHGCHTFLPRMKRQGAGFILNVASCAGLVTLPEMGAYNAAKAAVIALTETMAAEAASDGVHVSVLCPTFVKTNLMEQFRSDSERQRDLANALLRRSNMTADQVAVAALRGLERGTLVIIPQHDGAWLWRLKRASPSLHAWLVRKGHQGGWLERWLLPASNRNAPERQLDSKRA